MSGLIIEDGSEDRNHRRRLASCLSESTGLVRVATAYVTDRQFLGEVHDREVRLLTTLNPLDVACGATKLESVRALLDMGVECRELPPHPRLHAKVYVFGTDCAVVTSANLTLKGFDSNIEVGRETTAAEAQELVNWFDKLWKDTTPVTDKRLAELHSATAGLRRQFADLNRKVLKASKAASTPPKKSKTFDSVEAAFANATRFFVCNTDRRQGDRTTTGGFVIEEEMHSRSFAAAWEEFKFNSHMEYVEPGHVVFMFAKAVGIIGIGVAEGPAEKLRPNQSGRITDLHNTVEWRIPMRWLDDWRDDVDAFDWKSSRFTFWDVTEPKYDRFRARVRAYFLDDR